MFSLRGRYELATAAVIVNNVKHKLPFRKRSEQYYIQTWHGDFALKFIEKEVEDKLNPLYVEESKADSKETDLILSGSRQFTSIAKKAFWYDGEIFECGVPCNDPFFSPSETARRAICDKFGIPEDFKIALYAPTFRDGKDKAFELPDFETIVDNLTTITGWSWVLLVRFHPLDQEQLAKVTFSERILNGSGYPDPQDITKASDFLITDYSSIMYDFALQRKPVILFAPDIENYQQTRGLRDIFWDVPFPLARTQGDIPGAIAAACVPSYIVKLESFLMDRVCSFDDGHASERVVERIKIVTA
jgi:CDP-glycerol glycerophosphotransferase